MKPIERKHRDLMNRAMEPLAKAFKGYGVTLLVFELDKPGRVNYISNADRTTMITALKEFIARNEGRVQDPPDTIQ